MHPINIQLHKDANAVVRGAIYSDRTPEALDSELLEVELPHGVFIDVGWYPSGDPDGAFYVTAFLGSWDHILRRKTTRSPREAASLVENWVEVYTSPLDRRYLVNADTSTGAAVSGDPYWQPRQQQSCFAACV